MSPSERKYKSCTRKKFAHLTYASALEHAVRLGLGVYKCYHKRPDVPDHYDHHWHAGHRTSDPILRSQKRKHKGKRFIGKRARFSQAA